MSCPTIFRLAALAGILSLLVVRLVGAEDQQSQPEVPSALQVPSGQKLFVRAEAKGVQIYKSVEGKDGKLEWVLEAPLAELFGVDGKTLGRRTFLGSDRRKQSVAG